MTHSAKINAEEFWRRTLAIPRPDTEDTVAHGGCTVVVYTVAVLIFEHREKSQPKNRGNQEVTLELDQAEYEVPRSLESQQREEPFHGAPSCSIWMVLTHQAW